MRCMVICHEAQVSEIYVDQKLGDAYVYVRITVPRKMRMNLRFG